MHRYVAALFALLALAVVVPAAHASSAGSGWFSAAPGERNDVTITISDGRFIVTDAGADLSAASYCDQVGAHTANCPVSPHQPGWADQSRIDLGDGDDILHADDGPDVIDAGPGNDEVHGGAGADTIKGGPGDDLLEGGGGDTTGRYDSIANDAGLGIYNDTLDGGPGADVLEGGGGDFDTVDYSSRTNAISVTFDGIANDGEAGEGDNIASDVENVTGGSGNDVMIGSPGPNTFEGGAGDDFIEGGGGYQDLGDGGDGNDVIRLLDGGMEALKGIDGPIPGFKFDDMARCDSWALGSSNGDDIAFVDPTDAGQAGQLSAADRPCEHIVMAATPQSLPVSGGTVTLPVSCGAGPGSAACNGDVTVRLPKRVHAAARAGKPAFGQTIAHKRFQARFSHRTKAHAKLSKSGRSATRKHRVRAWVVYSYRRR